MNRENDFTMLPGCPYPLGATWDGKYRDGARRFRKGTPDTTAEFATRLSGSSDLYGHNGRRPYASINFITCRSIAVFRLRPD